MRKLMLMVIVPTILLILSCRKENIREGVSLEAVEVPDDFTWESSRLVTFNIAISDSRFQDAIHQISLYDADPADGGVLIARGAASLISSFNVKLALSSDIRTVYLLKTAPDGSSVSGVVDVGAASVSVTVGPEGLTRAVMTAGKNSFAGLSAEPSCTRSITSSGDYSLDKENEVVCITASNVSIGINCNVSATVRVTGNNVRLNYINLNQSAKLIISSGLVVSAGSINMNGAATYLENNGTINFDSGFNVDGIFTNNGTVSVRYDFNLNSGSTFTNSGTVNVGGSLNFNSANTGLNGGKIITNDSFRLNSGTFVNNCSLYARNEYHNNGVMKNYSYIRADNTSYLNSGELGLYNSAMFSTTNIFVNASIVGYGSTSLIKVAGNSTINSATIAKSVQYCDANGIEVNNGNFTGGAKIGCDLYIPSSSCNAEGNGVAPITDRDGDGVADAIDAYPDDASKAFDNYYPSASNSASSTLAFEDTWPSKGDYDLNDIVISYKYQVVTDAKNQVVQVKGTYTLLATGGNYKSGFGVEFPLDRADVDNIVGGTLETGQAKAVIILFTDSRAEQANWNTRTGENMSPAKTYTMSFNVTKRTLLSDFGLGVYNPFIWKVTFGRGVETHLPGKTPTSLANVSLFGSSDDRSGNGKYYVSERNLPWGLDIPTGSFAYPSEGNDISKTYLYFAEWAASGGNLYRDWFSNTMPGYREYSKLFN